MSHWKKIDIYKIPELSACYVLILDKEFLYVGSTRNLAKRFERYRLRHSYGEGFITPWGTCDEITVKIRPSQKYADWLMIEERLIRKLRPILNRKGSIGRSPWNHRVNGQPLITRNVGGRMVQVMASVQDYASNATLETRQPIQ